jgi:hypothetical protein
MASRTSASLRESSASVEKNSDSIGSMFISPGCMRRNRHSVMTRTLDCGSRR